MSIGPQGLPPGYDAFRTKLYQLTSIDLTAYKDRQMIRRLSGYLKRAGIPDYFGLAQSIEKDPDALEQLKDFLTINVSEFFRNPERFAQLKERIIPELLQRFGTLSIWSAGCSIGAEPYSVSIILEELDPEGEHDIIATDIDGKALQAAQVGVYRDELLKEVSSGRRQYFRSLSDGTWEINGAIKQRVRFKTHDLLRDSYPARVHLILCRNVVIYFTDEAKGNVYRRFSRALVPGGYLMIGSTESIFNAGEYELRSVSPFVYEKEGG